MQASTCTARQLHPSGPVLTVDTTLTAQDEADIQSIFGVEAGDVQESVAISGTAITGTSNYLEEVNTFDMSKGHHFIILHVTADDADEITACMDPSQQAEPTVLDESGVIILQMKDDKSQTVKITAKKGTATTTENLTISGMTFAEQEDQPVEVTATSEAGRYYTETYLNVTPALEAEEIDSKIYYVAGGDVTDDLAVGANLAELGVSYTTPDMGVSDQDTILSFFSGAVLDASTVTVILAECEGNAILGWGTCEPTYADESTVLFVDFSDGANPDTTAPVVIPSTPESGNDFVLGVVDGTAPAVDDNISAFDSSVVWTGADMAFADYNDKDVMLVEADSQGVIVRASDEVLLDVTYFTPYESEDLESLTKAQILDLATAHGYTMTTTDSNTKAEIIADYLAQQEEAYDDGE